MSRNQNIYYAIVVILIVSLGLTGCAGNPIKSDKEPMAAALECAKETSKSYLPDGHIYTTLSIADIGGYEKFRQWTLSYYSQYPDIDPDYEATPVSIKYLLTPWKWEWRNDITGALHSLHGGGREKIDVRRKNIQDTLGVTLKKPQQDWLSGLLIHAYADTYSHTKNRFNAENEQAYNVWIGHAIPTLLGKSPDNIKSETNEPKYLGYITDLYNTIKTNDNTDEFIKFKHFVDELKCEKGECPNFFALFHNKPLTSSGIDVFTDCMNKTSRQLSAKEIKIAIDYIKNGLSR